MVTLQLQVERGTGKVRRSKTNVLTTVQRNQLQHTATCRMTPQKFVNTGCVALRAVQRSATRALQRNAPSVNASLQRQQRRPHTYEAISTALSGLSIGNDDCLRDVAEWFEVAAQGLVGRVVRQAADEDLREGRVAMMYAGH